MSTGYYKKQPNDNKKEKLNKTKDHILADLVSKFNIVIIGMVRHITDYYGDTSTAKLQIILTNIINDTPNEPISYFILNVYKNDDYRTNILRQNDKFFWIKHMIS